MSSPSEKLEPRRLPIAKLFEESRVPLAKLPVLITILEDFAEQCAVSLRDLTSLETEAEIKSIGQKPAAEFLQSRKGTVGVFFAVPEWQSQIVVSFDQGLVVYALDAMCGGGGIKLTSSAARALSSLEQDVATHIATAIVSQLRSRLEATTQFNVTFETIAPALDPELFEANKADYLVVEVKLSSLDQTVHVGFPAQALEFCREKLSIKEDEEALNVDPGWSRQFQIGLVATQVDLKALAVGPPMTLGDVARLKVGSIVEFDPDALQHVRIESSEEPVFEGRLGQSKGYFTICIESPLKPAKQEEQSSRGAKRAK